jgi:hypothetical protein
VWVVADLISLMSRKSLAIHLVQKATGKVVWPAIIHIENSLVGLMLSNFTGMLEQY